MAVQIQTIVDNDDAERMLTRFALWLDDQHLDEFTRDAFDQLMTNAVVTRFQTESDNGQPWEPLTEFTIRRRREEGFGRGPINVRTGQMKKFLIHSRPQGGISGDGIEYSWPEPAYGTLYLKLLRAAGFDKRTPARPVINMSEGMIEDVIDEAFQDLERFM